MLLFFLLCAGMLFCSSPASALNSLQLSGNDYTAYIFCRTDIGDFCDQGSMATETFAFDDDSFEIESFGDGLEGAVSDGDFSSSGMSFDAEFTGYDGADQYTFDINGYRILDFVLIGTMDIDFEENAGLFGGEESGSAFFIAIRK
jgi:hypothetical protein